MSQGGAKLVIATENEATREREVRALTKAMEAYDLTRGLILTDADADPIRVEKGPIEVRSVATWLLRP